jgi:hypothetical protein
VPDAKRPLKVPRPVLAVLAALLVWAAARHWPAVPLIYAGLTRQRPGPAAVRYLLAMRGERVPAALARGEIHAGQPVAEVIEQHGPFGVETVGRYQLLREPAPPGTIEFEGYRILARDGVLVLAGWWTCTAGRTRTGRPAPGGAPQATRRGAPGGSDGGRRPGGVVGMVGLG